VCGRGRDSTHHHDVILYFLAADNQVQVSSSSQAAGRIALVCGCRIWPNSYPLFCFVIIPEANEGLEKARAYLNQVPWDQRLNVPSEGHKSNPSLQFFLGQG